MAEDSSGTHLMHCNSKTTPSGCLVSGPVDSQIGLVAAFIVRKCRCTCTIAIDILISSLRLTNSLALLHPIVRVELIG